MTPEIEKRIKLVQAGKVPSGYKLSKVGVIPNEWSLTYLKDVAIHVTEKNKDNAISLTLTNSATKGVIKQTEYFDKQISNKENTDGYFVVQNGDYIYNPRISESAPCGPINRSHLGESGIASPLYTVFRMNSVIHNECYIEMFLKSPFWHRYMCGVANYGARHDRMNITNDDLFSMPLPVPPKREQEKIAEILAAQDRVIEFKEKLIAEKQTQKKVLKQQIFSEKKYQKFVIDKVQIDKKNWKKEKFEKVFDFFSTNSLSREFLSTDIGEYKNIHYGDILVKYSDVLDSSCVEIPYISQSIDCSKFVLLKSGDIIIADTAEDYTAGKTIEIQNVGNQKIVAGLHTMMCRPKGKFFAPKWLGFYMNSNSYHDQLLPLITSMKVASIAKKEIVKTFLTIPSLPEQQAIAKVLSVADEEISLLQKDLEQEKLKKKSLMQLLLTGLVRVSA